MQLAQLKEDAESNMLTSKIIRLTFPTIFASRATELRRALLLLSQLKFLLSTACHLTKLSILLPHMVKMDATSFGTKIQRASSRATNLRPGQSQLETSLKMPQCLHLHMAMTGEKVQKNSRSNSILSRSTSAKSKKKKPSRRSDLISYILNLLFIDF